MYPTRQFQPETTGIKGVYFLANDRVLEVTLAFLNSFRAFNPEIPLCLIPFRGDIEKLRSIQEKYQFSIYQNQGVLDYCDAISLSFHPEIRGHYRKLAMWEGPFQEFVYIDVDIVILKNLDFAFRLLKYADFIVSFSNLASIRKWVWKDSIYVSGLLQPEQIEYAANTGFIVSRRSSITREMIQETCSKAEEIVPHMELSCMEQPLLNYLIVRSGKPYSSLYNLLDTPLFPENYSEFWAGNRAKDLEAGLKTTVKGKQREILLLHWAGVWQLPAWEIRLYGLLKLLKVRKRIWTIRIFMPFRKIWKHYRYLQS